MGTVFRKLLENKIVPDMAAVLDPQERTYKQIEGLEDKKVPMLLAVTAYWKFAANYKGDKYLVPLAGMHEEQENEEAWVIGRTVTSGNRSCRSLWSPKDISCGRGFGIS